MKVGVRETQGFFQNHGGRGEQKVYVRRSGKKEVKFFSARR
jgi:hypothetical protein